MIDALSRFDESAEAHSQALSETRKAARFNLFEDEPRLLLARIRLNQGKIEESARLLEDARRLNPRSRETRLLLLQQHLLLNDGKGVAEETSALHHLIPQGRAWYAGLLVNLLRNPLTSRQVLASLPSHPSQIPVLQALAEGNVQPLLLREASSNLRGRAKPGEANPWVDRIVMPLVKHGNVAEARHLWSYFYAVEGEQNGVPFDGKFTGSAGSPFGWALPQNSGGVAELAGGALRLQYFGRKSATLAQQLISLKPGIYRLRFDAVRMDGLMRDGLFWKVRCANGAELLRSPIRLSPAMRSYRTAAFTVPASECPDQWLALDGESQIDPQSVSASVESIEIERM